MIEELLDTEAVARNYGLAPVTLRKWRMNGVGPRFVRLGRAIRYRKSAVDDFLASREFTTTTEADIRGAA